MIGRDIGQYRIVEKIGEGGMGEVYLATDTSLDRKVALKFLPASLRNDPEARERLLREAKAASKLNHKNILTIYSVESIDDHDFIAMEYIEGESLKEKLDRHEEIPISQILRIGLHLCDGLAAAHEQGVVHRDIKPANILVTPKGQVKITDFGLATWQGAQQLTKEGSTVGTAAYMSPEQVQGLAVDARSDIFSAGIMLYELITQHQPFPGEHDAAKAYSILNEQPEPLERYKSSIHPGLQEIITRALEKDPSMRYQSAMGMLADLKRIRREIEGPSQPSAPSRAMPVQKKRSYVKPVVAGAIVVVAALVLFILKPFKLEIAPEQQASASENSIAVLYFDNVPDANDSDKTAQMITSLLISGLSESQSLQVVSRQRLYDILALLGKADAKSVDRTTATEVAEKAGVRWMVTGEVLQTTPRLVVTAEVAEVNSGKLVTTQTVEGKEEEDIFAVAGRVSQAIRDHMALPGASPAEETESVATVTTRSPEAYRYYMEGLDYAWRYFANDAMADFKKALSYDSTFAMAYYQLATLPGAGRIVAVEYDQMKEWMSKAEQYADNASWKEQRYIKAGAHRMRGEIALALAEWDKLLARYPNDTQALNEKGGIGNDFGLYDMAIQCFERIIELEPNNAEAYNMLAYLYDVEGNIERSLWAINRYFTLAPNDPNPYDSRGDLYSYHGDLKNATASFIKALELKPDFGDDIKLGMMYLSAGEYARAESTFQALAQSSNSSQRSRGRAYLALIPLQQYRYKATLQIVDDGLSADRLEGYQGNWYMAKLVVKAICLIRLGESDKAVATQKEACALQHELVPSDASYSRPILVLRLEEAGDTAQAIDVLDSLRQDILAQPDTLGQSSYYNLLTARIQLLGGNAKAAMAAFAQVRPDGQIGPGTYSYAQLFIDQGMLDKAVDLLERKIANYDGNGFVTTTWARVRGYYLLGIVYERSGWKDKAIQQYQTFLEFTKNADPGIPEVDDAETRLAALQQGA
jgi:serine/threonine protein kinase/Flp pilus assembly protein TadD